MKKYMLFTGYDTDNWGTFQEDYDTVPEVFNTALAVEEDPCVPPYYKIISSETNQVLIEGSVKNLLELLSPGARVGMDFLLSPVPSG